jgi:hypothetical protein
VTWLTLGLVAALSACGSADGTSTSAGRSTSEVPERLNTIEEASEDIIDIVPKEQWADITRDVRDVDAAWSRYRRQAVVDGARAGIVSSLEQALGRLRVAADSANGPETAQAANDLSAATVELYGLYDIARPVDIGRLDVVGRQIILDEQRGDPAAAGAQVRRVVSIWNGGLREDILAHHGAGVADQTRRLLTAMSRAVADGDRDAVVSRAKAFLEVVDAMERLY